MVCTNGSHCGDERCRIVGMKITSPVLFLQRPRRNANWESQRDGSTDKWSHPEGFSSLSQATALCIK